MPRENDDAGAEAVARAQPRRQINDPNQTPYSNPLVAAYPNPPVATNRTSPLETERVDGRWLVERRGRLGAFRETDHVADAGAQVVVNNERGIPGEWRHRRAAKFLLVERLHEEEAAALVGGILLRERDASDDVTEAH